MSQQYKQNLANARNEDKKAPPVEKNKKSLGKLAGDIAKEAGIPDPASLIGFIMLNDLFFFFAMMMALLKDILDPTAIGSAPPVGTILTLMVAITLGFAMLICGTPIKSVRKNKMGAKEIALKVTRKWGTLAAGTIFETLFGLNFLPVETLTAFIIYIFILKERKETYEAWQKESQENSEISTEYA